MQRKILQLTFSAKVATSANNGIILMLNVSVKSSPVGKRLETQSNEAKLSELPACTQIKCYRKKIIRLSFSCNGLRYSGFIGLWFSSLGFWIISFRAQNSFSLMRINNFVQRLSIGPRRVCKKIGPWLFWLLGLSGAGLAYSPGLQAILALIYW